MANGIRNDSLVFNIKFGDSKKDFFNRCWQLNKEGLVSQGPNNKYVQHILKTPKQGKSNINMLFYGIFDRENKITGMDLLFSYTGWSPWNKKLTATNLVPALKDSLETWYPGNPFIALTLKETAEEAFIKVDGNRQITIYARDTKDVVVKMEDLRKKYASKFK